MSNRINTITVVLEKDTRDDDCESILTAIRMVKGVLSVTPNVADSRDHLAEIRVRHELKKKLWDVILDA
jgi:hypothetical protein